MPSVYTKIMAGDLPGRFVYTDDQATAFLTVAPLRPGHTLVVPRQEIDHWQDLPPELAAHVFAVAQRIALALRTAFPSKRVGLVIAGLEVRHTHLHVVPIDALDDLDFRRVDTAPDPTALDDAAERIGTALAALG
jgi:histidine triad (HIT) family protein